MEVTIRSNDSFWYYSQLLDIPLQLIENSNPQIAVNQLPIGGRAQIPGYMLDEYVIEQGDALWKIANNHTIPMDALFLVNPFVDQHSLKIGQTIYIPQRVNDYIVTDLDNYTYEKMVQDISHLQEIYPFIWNETIGQSVMGKDIIEIQIGIGRKNVHVNGAFHANEWITTPVIMRFLNQYAMSLTNTIPIRDIFMLPLFLNTTLSLVPMVNPDGVNLVLNGSSAAGSFESEVLTINNQNGDFSNWKANIRGVDLNNQYPALWEFEAERKPASPQPMDYPGSVPLSEPESIAMADLARTRNFDRINAFHTQGEVINWRFEGHEPPISQVIVQEYARVSGYLPVRYVDSNASYKDWYIQEFKKPGYRVGLATGVNPIPIEQFSEIYQESLGIMLSNLYL